MDGCKKLRQIEGFASFRPIKKQQTSQIHAAHSFTKKRSKKSITQRFAQNRTEMLRGGENHRRRLLPEVSVSGAKEAALNLTEFQINVIIVVLILCCGCCVFACAANDWCTCADKKDEEEERQTRGNRMSRASRESWDETMGQGLKKKKGGRADPDDDEEAGYAAGADPMKTLARLPSGRKHRASKEMAAAAEQAKKKTGLKKKQSVELMEFGVSLQTEEVKVKVPKNAKPGEEVTFKVAGGRSTTVILPKHARPGMILEVQVSKINTGTSM